MPLGHVNYGLIAAVAKVMVPGLEIRCLSGIEGRIPGSGGTDMPNMGRMQGEAKEVAGFEDNTTKNRGTCFVSNPIGGGVKRGYVTTGVIEAQHRN
jgi:hypothetical protein